jgi:DNA-binding response OmpR family regulator
VIQLALQIDGYNVFVAQSAEVARSILTTKPIALCLIDLHLADENGFDLVREIRARWPARIIILSGMDVAENVVAHNGCDTDLFIAKPFGIREFRRSVKSLLP